MANEAAGTRATRPAVHVVVVTYESADVLPTLLSSLDDGLAGVGSWHLTVVDNASTDGTPELVARLAPRALLVPMGRNAGYAAAINAGARHGAADEVLLVLNPDVRLYAGAVVALLDALADPRVGIAVPRLVGPDGATAPSLRRDPSVGRAWAEALLGGSRAARLGWAEQVTEPEAYTSPRDADWATGAAMAISPACRSAVGDWDESFFLYSEEVDYCQRTRDVGLAVRYVPDAVATHLSGPYGGDVDLWRLVVRNRLTLFARRHSRASAAAFRAGVLVGQALRAPVSPAGRAGAAEAWAHSGRPAGFVWFAAQDWWYHNRAHSDFQLMQEVARTQPVLLVNSLGLRLPTPGRSSNPARRIGRKLRSMAKLVRRPVPGLPGYHVMTPIMLPAYGDGALARLNALAIRLQVRLVATAIGIGRAPAVAVTIPTAWPVVRRMRRSALLFNRSDRHSEFPEADQQLVAGLEDALLREADRVLYVSHQLMAEDAPVVGDRAVFLDHGVDLEHFALVDGAPTSPEPELADVPHPVVGFFGGLDDYVVDLELLAETARAIPEASVVLVGDATCPMDALEALPNVHWLGFQPYERIPALGRHFDVALMPWLDNDWIRYANPIKLKEYLALGLPVVSTDYPEVHHGNGHVAVARDRAEFAELVRRHLADPGDATTRRARRESVLGATWRARADQLLEIAAAAGRA
ncbi:glycosyltransferase [Actinotalea fermentans]|uniref:Glycosyltransferase 2-like domain-containing protein n=1 Tax=Actinotalea fermentans TaxID=43671 RepID=A0A511YWX7_9CELL|nr:glycosyltransferase [Actinotalea fermentans]KGM15359.1 hypothetical protein N867_09335 [Actinotalea fermentans ATCC 43279 = JCM 9966 = DSM 3133]GEN79710.1 hypothetical protein AFE02nite_14440 [Actinotalea fermentans]